MKERHVTTPYPLIDSDPHAFRVIRYFRPSDYATIAAGTTAFPAALYFWDMADPTHVRLRTSLRLGGFLGFIGGFLLAYQRSSCASFLAIPTINGLNETILTSGLVLRILVALVVPAVRFWGWSENKREEELDLAELSQRAKDGKPLYGESHQPLWVQGAAHNNSLFSQLKFHAFPWFNLVNHPYHGTDPANYDVKSEEKKDGE